MFFFFFSSRRRHTRCLSDWSSDVCSSDLPMPPTPPMPAKVLTMRMSDDRLYSSGQSALDNRQWEQAVEYFGQVVTRNGARVDGALYWKAYALGRLGKRDEANAAIAELRKGYATSRWLDDAKALE